MKKKTNRESIQSRVSALTLLILIAISIGRSQNYNITGQVVDVFNLPVAGCDVSLVGYNADQTTASDGRFSISGNFTGTSRHFPRLDVSSYFNGQTLTLNTNEALQKVRVHLYTIQGKMVASILSEKLARGRYTVNPGAYIPAKASGSIYLLKVQIGSYQRSYKISSGHYNLSDKIISEIRVETSELQKRNAPGDSLTVHCQGNLPQKLAVENSDSVKVIVSPLWDIVVYGGTSAGVIAAVQAVKMGKSVVIVSPDYRLGGLSSGGLGQTDIGNKQAIGGLSLNFYERIAQKYNQTGSQWTFEPKVALEIFNDYIEENNIPVVYRERLDLNDGVVKEGTQIKSFRLESGSSFSGKMFIDATYEGDLMAKSNVSYTFGREANSVYNETLNGVQVKHAIYHQLRPGVDPYVVKGDPSSGLLPWVDPEGPGAEGSGDKKIQAYCFRLCLTNVASNMVPIEQPEGYKELEYELFFRHLEQGGGEPYFLYGSMPNNKTDWNNKGGFSTDWIGANYEYPDGDYQTREKFYQDLKTYTQGWLWVLQHHPRVPQATRNKFINWGLPKDEYLENGHWSPQLYVREARRMVGQFVMTENHVMQREKVTESVGMGAYQMDSHQTQRYITSQGFVQNEGDVEVGVSTGPYPIAVGAILPKKEEASNLVVPVCLSASHIAFGSIRMEPVFMILGQSAATLASHAIDEGVSVQDVNYPDLYDRMVADDQVLGINRPITGGILLDDSEAALTGQWVESSAVTSLIGTSYRHDNNNGKGSASAIFSANIAEPGDYEVRFYYTSNANRATNVPVTITHSGGATTVEVNEQASNPTGIVVGTFTFGASATVTVSNTGTDGYVVIDGVQFVKK